MDINGRVSNAGTCVTKLYVADSSKGVQADHCTELHAHIKQHLAGRVVTYKKLAPNQASTCKHHQ